MIYFILIAYWLAIGSFLNVCIFRIPRSQSISDGRSRCTRCGQTLKWYDLVPVFSFIALRGKCRSCNSKISSRYLWVEVLNALVYLQLYRIFGFSTQYIIYALFASSLIVITFIDYEHKIIPNRVLLFIGVITLVSFFISSDLRLLDRSIGFFAVSFPLLLISILSRGGIGGGDIKMMAVCGAFIGWKKILLSLIIGSVIGAVIGVTLILLGKKDRKDIVPFGPFLACGIYISIIVGDQILKWYLRLI